MTERVTSEIALDAHHQSATRQDRRIHVPEALKAFGGGLMT